MTNETRNTLLKKVNEITELNMNYLSTLSEIDKSNGKENISIEQQKSLSDASMKLIQAGTKILESCK